MATSSSKLPSTKTDFKQLGDKATSGKKIESPFAKYNSIGQLTCIICNQVVKSDLMWNAHLNSKTHIDNKNNFKSKLTEASTSSKPNKVNTNINKQKATIDNIESNVSSSSSSPSNTFKRPISTISKTSKEPEKIDDNYNDDNDDDENVEEELKISKKQKLENLINKIDVVDLNGSYEDDSVKPKEKIEVEKNTEKINSEQDTSNINQVSNNADLGTSNAIPEGFFDDPELDAKARGVTRAEVLDAEYEEFKKIILTEEHKSDQIIEKDDLIRDVDRDLEEVEELITRWTKIENLHQKREELKAALKIKKDNAINENKTDEQNDSDDSDDSDVDIDNVLNLALRSKNRC